MRSETSAYTAGEYAEAASVLHLLGCHAEADALAGADAGRSDRYRDRVPTLTERRDDDLLRSGRVRFLDAGPMTGVDGADYAAAVFEGPAGATMPAVVAATHADSVELISGFRTIAARDAWLADRTQPPPGSEPQAVPLAACTEGPECRIAWEERVLARLLTGGDPDGTITGPLSPTVFSVHSRFDIYLAFLAAAPDTDAVLARLGVRAQPGPALPGGDASRHRGDLALAYAGRLAATPVTRHQAASAVAELARETGQVLSAGSETAERKARWPMRSAPAGAAGAATLLREPGFPLPEPPAPGTVPRM